MIIVNTTEFFSICSQSQRESFLDPCLSNPCRGKNSFCQSVSANEFKCQCQNHYLAINGNALEFGCVPLVTCGPHSNLQMDGSCRCLQDFFEQVPGDAQTTKGCQKSKS